MSVAGNSNEEYVCDGNKAVKMALIRTAENMDDDTFLFIPSFCHQIFGPRETIYGYKDLEILIFFSAGHLNPYLRIEYSEKISSKGFACADDIEKILAEKLEINFGRNLDDFIKNLANEAKFKPMGRLQHTFQVNPGHGDAKTFVIYQGEISTKGLVPYHERLQTFNLWFIDAASAIDTDDERWRFFYVFEKYQGSNKEELYAMAGFATVYEYWAYPANMRPRISQMLVLPPFQKQGVGAQLLQTIYTHYKCEKTARDITVEDPSEEMQSLRDFVDCRNLLEIPEIRTAERLTRDTVRDAARKLKITDKQSRRLYEILRMLRLKSLDGAEYEEFRLEVKSRLNGPHQSQMEKLKKLEKIIPKQVAEMKSSALLTEEKRISNLETAFKDLESQYESVIERIRNSV